MHYVKQTCEMLRRGENKFIYFTLWKWQNSNLFGVRTCDGDEPLCTPEHSNSVWLKWLLSLMIKSTVYASVL